MSGTGNLKSWKRGQKKTDSNEPPRECAAGGMRFDRSKDFPQI